MTVRPESPSDVDAVREVHLAAFAREGGPAVEALLLDALRAAGDVVPDLTFVAAGLQEDAQDDVVLAQVTCSRATVDGRDGVVGLGPIGVLPAHQRAGLGSALVHAALEAADAAGLHAVVLLGSPLYYGRFGFRPAAEVGIGSPDPAWGEFFQVRTLAAWDGSLTGPFRYAPAFDLV